jgi:exopolysaccharide production repressor protein
MGHCVWHCYCTVSNAGGISHPGNRGVNWGPRRFANGAAGSFNGCGATMYFPQFLVGMFATSFIVAIWADIETGSVWTALG